MSDFKDELGEAAKDMVKIAKKQILSKTSQTSQTNQTPQTDKKDPITGKPVPSKRVLSDLKNATAQVAQMKLKQIREELEKQRLKTKEAGPSSAEAPEGQRKPKEDAIAKTLKQSKSTGEFGKNIGG